MGIAGWLALPVSGAAVTVCSVYALTHVYAASAPATRHYSFVFAGEPATGPLARRAPAASDATVAEREKAARLTVAAAVASTPSPVEIRFDRVIANAGDLHRKLVEALESRPVPRGPAVVEASPSAERFAELASASEPDAGRFGPATIEVERSSRLALALAGESEIEVAYADPAPGLAYDWSSGGLVLAPQTGPDDTSDQAELPEFEAVPDNAPLPARRPTTGQPANAQPSAPPATAAPARAVAAVDPKPAKPPAAYSGPSSPRADGNALAFARPDDPVTGVGKAFRNLFGGSTDSPRAQGGVAIYDISAQRVYLPDGQQLEAHSGLGHMVDDVRYVDQKNRGPTPPNTYNLSLREAPFHGVEAIRLTPTDGRNKYGRDGLLAHTYMLRGGLAESNGCVVFKDYGRFLKAFKQGKIRRMVVVTGGGRAAATRVADNGRGA